MSPWTCTFGPSAKTRRPSNGPLSTPWTSSARRCQAARPRRRSVLYHDDRQVKFLYAGLDQNWTRNSGEDGRSGSVFIIARRASDVITDLCMAGRLSREFHDEDEDSPFWTPDLPDDPESGSPLTNPSTPEERYLAEAFRFDYITDLQDAILARTNASLITGPDLRR